MRKHRLVSARLGLGFDALETRELLSVGSSAYPAAGPIVLIGPHAGGLGPLPVEIALTAVFQQSPFVVDDSAVLGPPGLGSHGTATPLSATGEVLDETWTVSFSPSGVSGSIEVYPEIVVGTVGPFNEIQVGFSEGFSVGTMNVAHASPGYGAMVATSSEQTGPQPFVSPSSSVGTSPDIDSNQATGPGMPITPPVTASTGIPSVVTSNSPGAPPDNDPSQILLFGLSRGGDEGFGPQVDSSPMALPTAEYPTRLKPEFFEFGPPQVMFANVSNSANGPVDAVVEQAPEVGIETPQTIPSAGKVMDGNLSLVSPGPPGQPAPLVNPDRVSVDPLSPATINPESSLGANLAQMGGGVRPVSFAFLTSRTLNRPGVVADWTDGWISDNQCRELLSSRSADVIAEAIPLARGSLEDALEDFVNQLGGIELGLFESHVPSTILWFTAGAVTSLATAEFVRRHLQRRSSSKRGLLALDTSGRQHTLGFPELPGSWSERRA